MTKYSLIFSNINDNISKATNNIEIFTSKFGILGRSLSDIYDVFKNGGVSNVANMLTPTFGNFVTKTDVSMLHAFNEALQESGDATLAFDLTMKGASKNARKLAQNAGNAGVDIDALTVSTNGSRLAMIGASIAATALNVALTLGISLAIQGVIQLIDYWAKSQERANEAVKDAAQELSELKSELKSLDEYKDKISGLRDELDKGTLSQADANKKREELLALQDELIEKYGKEEGAIKNIRAAILGETDALDQLSKQQMDKWLTNNKDAIATAKKYANESIGVTVGTYYNDNPEISRQIRDAAISLGFANAVYEGSGQKEEIGFSGTREEIINKISKFREWLRQYCRENNISTDIRDYFLNGLDDQENYITDKNADDGNFNNQMSVYRKAIEYEIAVNHSELYESLNRSKNQYEKAILDGNQQLAETAYSSFQDTIKEFGEKIKNGSDSLTDAETAYVVKLKKDLEDEASGVDIKIKIRTNLKESGLDYDDIVTAKQIAELNNISTFNLNPDSRGIPIQQVRESTELTVEQARLYNNIVQAAEEAGVSVDKYIDSLVDLNIIQKQVSDSTEEVTEKTFALSKDQASKLKSVHSDVDKLNKAYQNLFAGKLTTNDVAELVDLFPTLGEYVDWTDEKFGNLAEGIDKVIKERPADLIKQLEEIDQSGMSEDAKKAINSMIAALKQLKPELKGTKTLIEDIQKAIKGVSSSISTLIGFTKEISSDGALSLSSIDTILTDDTYQSLRPYLNDMEGMQTAIEELVNKQKDAYEDLYNAEMYEQDAEAYHKAVEEKEKSDKNLLKNSVKRIKDEIKYFNDAYDIDITNWESLTDTKKTILQNTNAELLSKQNKLINEFSNSYGVDLTNFAKAADAKAAILDNLGKSQAIQNVTDYLNSQSKLGSDWYAHTPSSAIPENVKSKVAEYLSAVGMTFEDWQSWVRGDHYEEIGNKIQQSVEQIIKGFTITDVDWKNITANVGSSGSSATSTAKQYFDWIERRLKKFADTTKRVFAKVKDYITFTGKNSQLSNAINAIQNEIAVNEQAYNRYMAYANGVNLSEYYKSRVRDGSIDIEIITNSDLQEKINKYKEYYDNAMACKDAVDSLKETEKEYAQQQLSNVEKYYDNRIAYANSDAEYYNSLDTETQYIAKNYNGIRKSYNQQIIETENKAKQLRATLNSLVSQGLIKYGSDEWYEWIKNINECTVSVRELKKSIHELAVEELEGIQADWDNRINSIENTISYIDAFNSDDTRNAVKNYNSLKSSYNQEVSYTDKQAAALQKRLDEAVKSGDIQKYSNEWYNWTQTIEEARTKVVELKTSIHELAIEEFNDIVTKHDNLLNGIDHQKSLLEESIHQTEEKGYIVSTKYYNALIQNERNNISQLSAKRNELASDLQKAINAGNIEKGSQAWYDMVQEINDVDLAIQQANTSVIEFNNSIRDIQWQIFDLLQDKISQITQESDFLIDLMKNDKLYKEKGQGAGQLTSEGLATMGLHGVNYNTYMAQADKYAKEIQKIDKQLATDPYNQDLIDRRKELLKLQQQSILSANDEKQTIVDMVKDGIDLELDALQDLIDKYNEALDSQKNLFDYQKNIKSQTKEIATLQKQLAAYTGDTSEETKAKVQQLKVSLEEAKENLQETQYDKFIDDQKKLLDDLYDEYESVLNQRLDDVDALISDMITSINDNAGIIKETLTEQAADVGYKILSTMTDIWKTGVNPVLSEYGTNFTNASNNVVTAINTLTSSINSMIAKLDNTSSNSNSVKTNTTLSTATVKNTSATTSVINNTSALKGNSILENTSVNNVVSGSSNVSKTSVSQSANKQSTATNTLTTTATSRTDKENYGVALAIWNGNYGWGTGSTRTKRLKEKHFDASKVQSIVNQMGKDGYVYSGAWVGKYYGIKDLTPYHYNKFKTGAYKINKDQMAWTQENSTPEAIIRPSDGAILTPLAKEDMVLNGNATANLFAMMNDPSKFIKDSLFENSSTSTVPNINNNTNSVSVNLENVNFTLPNVKNYDEFIYAIQHDKKFESLIKSMTTDRLFGGSSLKKYRV